MIFEFWLNPEHTSEYAEQSKRMRQLVGSIDGFVSVERFTSATDPGKILVLGYFEDEAAVEQWRTLPEHRLAQSLGRSRLFTDYRLRMGTLTRDYSLHQREQAPIDSLEFHQEGNHHV